MPAATIEHVNLTVSDAGRMAKLLEELFGWHVRWEGPARDGGRAIHVGDERGYLALYAPSAMPGPEAFRKGMPLNHVGILVDDLDAIEARVVAAGLTPFAHADYEPGRRFYFLDPDGTEFEVVRSSVTTNHDVSKLDDLIVTTIDSIKGYEHSAGHADAGQYAAFFHDMAADRRRVVEALSARSRELGGTPAEHGSAAATIHRRWGDLRRALGGGDTAILSEIERGEDYLKEEFDRVLKDHRMSEGSEGVVQQCYESVRRGHDRARALRDTLKATD